MFRKFSFVFLLLLLIIILSVVTLIHAGWTSYVEGDDASTVNIATLRESRLTGLNDQSVSIFARNLETKVKSTVTDVLILPGQCVSDVDQPYGWNTFKNDIMRSGYRIVNLPKGTLIPMPLYPRVGYSTSKMETITCTLTRPDGEEQPFYSTPSDPDKTFSFMITATTYNNLDLIKSFDREKFRGFSKFNLLPESIQSAQVSVAGDIYEKVFRESGLVIELILNGDYWLQEKVGDLAQYIKCQPIDPSSTAGDCLAGYIQPRHLHWDEKFPSVVSLIVPRDEMRTFNIAETVKLFIDIPVPYDMFTSRLPITLGRTSGFLVFPMPEKRNNQPMPTPSSPEVAINNHLGITYLDTDGQDALLTHSFIYQFAAAFPTQASNNTITISEDCIRGMINDTTACPRAYVFSMKSFEATPYHRFVSGVNFQAQDIRQYALTSQNGFPFADIDWVERFLNNANNMQGLLWMKGLTRYETATTDRITIRLPASCFTTYEPMIPDSGFPLTLIVTPSSGYITGALHDINQSDIWFSNVTMCLQLGGESFKPDVVNYFITEGSSGNISFGWDKQKSTLLQLPGGNVKFANFSSGRIDYTTLCFTLGQNADYEMLGGSIEEVNFQINESWIQSGLQLKTVVAPTFRILASLGEYSLESPAEIEEAQIRVGGVKMLLNLAGQKFGGNFDDCKRALCASWNSSSLGVDVEGWKNRNPIICDSFTSFELIDNRTLQLTLHADPDYNTIRGETITTLVPEECTSSVVPKGRPTFRILPQNGNISFQLSFDDGATLQYGDQTLESNIRAARCRIYIRIYNDTWDATNPNITSEIFEHLQSLQNEPYGWNNKKASLVKSVSVMNATHIQIILQTTTTYDITSNETLRVEIPPSWVNSRRAPQNPTVYFKIVASAGDVVLRDWIGSAENRDVDEDDIRWGRVWFKLALSGDQWRRDVDPYIRSFKSNQPSNPRSLHRLIPQLVPSMNFFKFTIDEADGSEILTLQLQSSSLYDIASDENVTLSFDPDTVASGIAPIFFVNNVQRSGFSFVIRKKPGRVLMSGEIYTLNEKKMRQSTELKIFLTLLGETWKRGSFQDNTTSATIDNLNAVLDPFASSSSSGSTGRLQQNGFIAFKASIIPKSRIEYINDNIMLIHFLPNRNYEIESNEYLEMIVAGYTVNSNLAPFTFRNYLRKLVMEITPTGGELRILPDGLVLDESVLRNTNFTVLVAVDGDRWAQNNLLDQSVAFVATAFGSYSSIIQEPHGFSSLKEEFLNIGGNRRPFVSAGSFSGQETLQVRLNPVSTYDINTDETILFSVTDPIFLTTGLLPEPNRVVIPVKAAPRVIVLVIEQSNSKAIGYRTNLLSLKTTISSLLGVSTERQNLVLNATAIRPDGMLAILLNFLPATTASQRETDPRSIVELSDTFLSIHTDYMYKKTSIRFAFRQDRAPPDSALVVTPPPTTADLSKGDDGFDYSIIAGIIGGVFILLMSVGFVVGLRLQRAGISTSAIKGSRRKRRDEGAEDFHDDGVSRREQAIELSINPNLRGAVARIDPRGRQTRHNTWDPNREDLHIIPKPAMSLRDHVRSELGLHDPREHADKLKERKRLRDLIEEEKQEELFKQKNPKAKRGGGEYSAKYYDRFAFDGVDQQQQQQRGRSFSPGASSDGSMRSPVETTFYHPGSNSNNNNNQPTTGRKEFKITNRNELKRLERLMSM